MDEILQRFLLLHTEMGNLKPETSCSRRIPLKQIKLEVICILPPLRYSFILMHMNGLIQFKVVHMGWLFLKPDYAVCTHVFHTVSPILHANPEPDPLFALFWDYWRRSTFNCGKALSFASLLSRRTILLKQKDSVLPLHS